MVDKLKIAIQKSGRLHDDSMKLLKECGIDISNGVNKLKAEASNFPVEVYFLRDDDIPQYVEDSVADIGFVGENVVCEKNKKVDVVEQLGFGRCRLSIAVSRNEMYDDVTFLDGKRIATTYPVIVQKFMDEIINEGELSLIFFNKQFSHAISKKPKVGDFRVQQKFGGTAEPVVPDKKIIQQAAELLNSINESLLYARVDGVVAADDKFYLMELELIEPRLSVSSDVKACEKFYEAFLQLLHVNKQV